MDRPDLNITMTEGTGSRGDVIRKTWAFCPVTGTFLTLDAAAGVARSEYCDFQRPLADLDDTMTVVTRADMPDYQRRYALEPLVKSKEQLEFEAILRNRVRRRAGRGVEV